MNDNHVHEGDSVLVTFSLSRPSSSPFTIHYTVSGTARLGQDYTLSGTPGVVTIPAGRLSANITFTALRDKVPERQEPAIITVVGGAQGGDFVKVFIAGQNNQGRNGDSQR